MAFNPFLGAAGNIGIGMLPRRRTPPQRTSPTPWNPWSQMPAVGYGAPGVMQGINRTLSGGGGGGMAFTNGGGGGGGVNPAILKQIMGMYQSGFESARNANEGRYRDIVGSPRDLYGGRGAGTGGGPYARGSIGSRLSRPSSGFGGIGASVSAPSGGMERRPGIQPGPPPGKAKLHTTGGSPSGMSPATGPATIGGGDYNRDPRYAGKPIGYEDPAMGGYYGMYDRSMEQIDKLGRQERSDLDTRYNAMGAEQNQDLISRGLSASTTGLHDRRDLEQGRSADVGRLNDRLAGMRLENDRGISQSMLDMMERREDEYPPLDTYANLLMQYGQSGGGGMGGGAPGLQKMGNAYSDNYWNTMPMSPAERKRAMRPSGYKFTSRYAQTMPRSFRQKRLGSYM